MNYLQYLFSALAFLAVVILIESVYLLWESYRSPEAKKIARRLAAAADPGSGVKEPRLLKLRHLSKISIVDKGLHNLPGVEAADRLLLQSGSAYTVAGLLGMNLLIFILAASTIVLLLHLGLLVAIFGGVVLALLPIFHVLRLRSQRLEKIGLQLPDSLDLLARALRAGYSFPAGMTMVASEAPEPIAGVFRDACDEINFGIAVPEAMRTIIQNAPVTDLRYFVTSVLIQRESGGNLAEVLGNIANLIRSRIKLNGQIRVLATEGKFSAWILTLLPFCLTGAMSIVNPKMIGILWHDPLGMRITYGTLAMMMLGIFWMWRIIKIRV